MRTKVRNLIFITAGSLMLMFSLVPSFASASCASPTTTQEQVQCGACNASGVAPASCTSAAVSKEATNTVNSTITNVINLLSIVAGIIAVIMLILGGIRYVTSSGNEQSVAGAKRTIIYAIIGLVIAATAQIIARFVLAKTTNP